MTALRSAAIALVAACWTAPTTTTIAPAQRDAPTAACTISDRDIDPPTAAKLQIEGRTFAILGGTLEALDVTFALDRGRARVETEAVELVGDLDLTEFPVRPRSDAPHDGWLVIDAATARSASRDRLRVSVALPEGVSPPRSDLDLACSGLTFAPPVERPPVPEDATWLASDEKLPLSATPGGPPVAMLLPTHPGRVLETRGAHVRIELDGDHSRVIAWIPKATAHEAVAAGQFGYGVGGGHGSSRMVSCDRDLPIYVAVHGRTKVGRLKPGNYLIVVDEDATKMEVDLGTRDLQPFVLVKDVERCND